LLDRVTEQGDDVDGYSSPAQRPRLADLALSMCRRGLQGRVQDGFAKTVTKIIEAFVPNTKNRAARARARERLSGLSSTPGDIDELRDIIECSDCSHVPSRSLRLSRRHIPRLYANDAWRRDKADIARMGTAGWTIAIGEQIATRRSRWSARWRSFALFDR